MFNVECCKGQRRCRTFELAKPKCLQYVRLKIGRCSKCGRFFVAIEKLDFYGKKTCIKKYGEDALKFYEKNLCNILYEIILIKHASSKVAWTYYKAVNAETQVRRYMDESGNASNEKLYCPVKVICA